MAEIITLSSDDEYDDGPPVKKIKIISENSSEIGDVLKKLESIKDLSVFEETKLEEKITENSEVVSQSQTNSLTIVIENGMAPKYSEKNKDHKNPNNYENDSGKVVIIDDSIEDELSEMQSPPKENTPNDATGILDDLPEAEDKSKIFDDSVNEHLADTPNASNINGTCKNETTEIYNRPSTSKASEAHILLDQFLETCTKSIKGSKFENRLMSKYHKLWKYFNKCENLHSEPSLKKLIQENTETAKFSPADAVVCFGKIIKYLLNHISGPSVEISEDNLRKIKKLEKTIKLLLKKIKKLEETEVEFDDENDSTYIQLDRYSQRLNTVYNKYCQILNKNPYFQRSTHEKIRFTSSKYNEINRAITKAYKPNNFPTYYDIEKCIKKCVEKNNMNLTEADIKEESKFCFTKLGNLLQSQRKRELYDIHCDFITLNEDPANKDQELKSRLCENQRAADEKMKTIVEKYVKLQEENTKIELSEDSDDSNYKSTETEDD